MAMATTVSLDYLLQNLNEITTRVGRGESFVVIREDKPIFKVVPVDDDAIRSAKRIL